MTRETREAWRTLLRASLRLLWLPATALIIMLDDDYDYD